MNANDKSIDVNMTFNEKMDASFAYTAKEGAITAEGDLDLTQMDC